MKYQVYISYREEDVCAARILHDKLQKKGYSVFFKDKNLKSKKSDEMLLQILNECQNFILVLTPDSLIKKEADDWMYEEITSALKNGKNIIPIALYEMNEFPEDLNQELADLKTCHIIKYIGNDYFWVNLYEGIIGKVHLFSVRNKFAFLNKNANLRKLIYISWIAGTIWSMEFIVVCVLHYTFKESWKLPIVLWSICKAFSGISVFQIIEFQLLHVIAILVIYWSLRKDNIRYVLKSNEENNINMVDFNDPVECLHAKLNNNYSSKRSREEKKEAISKDDNGEWNCFEENKGLIVGYLDGQYTTYMELYCRKWPKISICGIGPRTTKKTAIAMMEDQNIKYIGNQDQDNGNVLYFQKDDVGLAVLYGRVWPKIIEMKRQYVKNALNEYRLLQNFVCECEDNKEYRCIFRRQFQYNGQIYVVLELDLKKKTSNKYVVARRVGNEYVLVESDNEAGKILAAFRKGY